MLSSHMYNFIIMTDGTYFATCLLFSLHGSTPCRLYIHVAYYSLLALVMLSTMVCVGVELLYTHNDERAKYHSGRECRHNIYKRGAAHS